MAWKMKKAFIWFDRWTTSWSALLVVLGAWGYAYAPEIDIAMRPIVVSFSVDRTQSFRHESRLFLTGRMELARKVDATLTPQERELESACTFQAINIRDQAGRKLQYNFIDVSPERGATEDRGNGEQPWGYWRVRIGLGGQVTSTTARAVHECRQVLRVKTPIMDAVDWTWPWSVKWHTGYRVQEWTVQSTLWKNMPVSAIREVKELPHERSVGIPDAAERQEHHFAGRGWGGCGPRACRGCGDDHVGRLSRGERPVCGRELAAKQRASD